MILDVALLPDDLNRTPIAERAVVVFDVLRATTTIAAALHAGVSKIHVFGDLTGAKTAANAGGGNRILCGEFRCLPPAGFDLGNSPCAFNDTHRGREMFLSTTNGTRAFLAARDARLLLAGAIVNASAVARLLRTSHLDVTLLCAGTDGALALEDVLGAGAVIDALASQGDVALQSDTARLTGQFFQSHRNSLLATMRESQGGLNIRAVQLDDDITFAARQDVIDAVGVVTAASEKSLTLHDHRNR